MPTPSLPRRAAAWSALTLAGSVALGAPAMAAPGDNGDVKVHVLGTASSAHANQPKVCAFYLDAFNFDAGQEVTWKIDPQPAKKGTASLSGTLVLPTGSGATGELKLPDGQYKLTWTFKGSNGAAKQKVFRVDCPSAPGSSSSPSAPPGDGKGPNNGPHGGPNGGPPAGGGGLARTEAFSPVAGAAGVGLAAVGTAAWFRLRRRPHGAA